jgi:transposase
VGAYLGLCRRRRKSGDSDPQLGISKCGNPFLRRLLLQAAHYILGPFGPDCELRRWGLQLAGAGRAGKKRAVIAVARKLAVLMLVLWRDQQIYRPLRSQV